jgi:hypothetical protein
MYPSKSISNDSSFCRQCFLVKTMSYQNHKKDSAGLQVKYFTFIHYSLLHVAVLEIENRYKPF